MMMKNNNIKKVASYMDAVDEVLSSEIMDIGRRQQDGRARQADHST